MHELNRRAQTVNRERLPTAGLDQALRFASGLPQSSRARLFGACSTPSESTMPDAGGFEPPVACTTLVFKTSAFGRSARPLRAVRPLKAFLEITGLLTARRRAGGLRFT